MFLIIFLVKIPLPMLGMIFTKYPLTYILRRVILLAYLTENTSMYGQTIRQLLLSGIKFLLLTVLEGIHNVTICSLPCKRRYILAKISECMLSMDQMVGFSGHDLRGMRCQDHSFYSRNDPERCLLYDWPLFSSIGYCIFRSCISG